MRIRFLKISKILRALTLMSLMLTFFGACEIISKRIGPNVDPKKKRGDRRDDLNNDPNAPKASDLTLPEFSSLATSNSAKSQNENYTLEGLQMGSVILEDSSQPSSTSHLHLSTGKAAISEELKP